MNITELLAEVFWGNTLLNWMLSLAAFFITFTVLPAVRAFVMSRARRFNTIETRASTELVLLLITRTRATFLFIVAIYAAERFLTLPARIEQISAAVIVLVAWIQIALWGVAAVEFALGQREARKTASGEQRETGSISVLLFIARVAIFAFATLLALDNLGVNITALVAGLGIGGIAIALAVQTVLGDLLASLSIAFDKPFQPGDLLRLDDIEGTVEHIGVRSTPLRSDILRDALVQNNPKAFTKGNPKNMIPGSTLSLPDPLELAKKLLPPVIAGSPTEVATVMAVNSPSPQFTPVATPAVPAGGGGAVSVLASRSTSLTILSLSSIRFRSTS